MYSNGIFHDITTISDWRIAMHTINIERLRKSREKLGISKQEAAKRINVTQPAYLRYESGQRNPSIQVINEIAVAFGTSVDYLIGLADIDSPETLVVSKSNEPDLFEIVSSYKKLDDSQKIRLLAYASRLGLN